MRGAIVRTACVAFAATTVCPSSIVAAADALKSKTLAVVPFHVAAADSSLVRLAPAMTDVVANLLAEDRSVVLVERKRFADVLAEQKLQASSLVDGATAVRVGRLLGADLLLTGTVVENGAAVRLVLNVLAVAGGEAVGTLDLSLDRERLAEDLVAAGPRLATLVDVKFSAPSADQLDDSPLGSVHLLRGISCYNARLPDRAIVHLLRAVQVDPRLVEARLWIARSYLDADEPEKAKLELARLRTHARAESLQTEIDDLAREIEKAASIQSGEQK